MTILFESAIRVTLIAAVIALVLFAMRIKTASVLHAVWAGVVVTMLLLPAWVAWGPKASIPVLPPGPEQTTIALPVVEVPVPASVQVRSRSAPSMQPQMPVLMRVYIVGLLVFLLRLAIGTLRASRLTSSSCVVPVTVGLLHPRIILPECSREWPPAQMDAVLAHEGEHIRRRDPLFQWLALLNRALFWFHPLAWWLERKLSGLAEEACDAAVLARGCDPRDYSEYLLGLARSVARAGTRLEAVGMAMPGIGLKHRIRQILSGVPVPRISRARMACTVTVCAGAAAILAAGTLVRAQQKSTSRPAFEVASIRAVKPGEHAEPSFDVSPGSLTVRRENLRSLMAWAYRADEHEISGPGWLDTQDFDITAKAAGPASSDQLRLMLQTLIEERFKLALHREQKILPLYLLLVGKSGPKMHEIQEEPRKGGRLGWVDSVFTYQMVSRISQLTELLPDFLDGRPVQDKTGLTGVYEITLSVEMDPEQIKRMPQPGMVFSGFGYASGVFDAVEKLGLKLESTKAPVELLVIDHVEKPSEN